MNDDIPRSIVDVSGGFRSNPALREILDERYRSRGVRRLMFGVVAVLAAFFIWSAFAEVDEIAKARGDIIPKVRIQTIQSPEGGVIEELLVREDERVKAGQVIARFDPTSIESDVETLAVRRAGLAIDIERWGAIADLREPDFTRFRTDYSELTREARQLFDIQRREAGRELQAIRDRVALVEGSIRELEKERESLRAVLANAQDTFNRLNEGAQRGVVPVLRVNEARARVLDTRVRLDELEDRINDTRSELLTLQTERDSSQSQIVTEARTERSRLIEQLAEVEAATRSTGARSDRLEVVSPVDGIVKDVPDALIGAVIPPGGMVAEVVPTSGGLLLEARVSPRDIGFVRQGQPVLVKIDTYDFSRFGAVRGTVAAISPSAFENERTGERYYVVDVELSQTYVGADEANLLVPGMTAEADIVTGSKTVLGYLLKPVVVGLSSALHER